MINDQLRCLIITNFVPQHDSSSKINSSLRVLDYSNFTNVDHPDFDDFKAQFVSQLERKYYKVHTNFILELLSNM